MKLSELLEGLTIHGVRYIFIKDGSRFSRIFWSLAVLSCICGWFFVFHLLYLKFHTTPDINVRVGNTFINEVPFPAVTICTPLFAKDSLVRYYDISRKNRLYPNLDQNLTATEQNYLYSNIQACSPDSIQFLVPQMKKRTENDVVKLLNESSLSVDEAMISCSYRQQIVNCSRVFNRVLTDRGFCYSFNMQSFKTIFNEKIISKDFYSYKRFNIARNLFPKHMLHNQSVVDDNDTSTWSLDHGYPEFPKFQDPDAIPVKATKRKVFNFSPYLKEADSTNVCTTFGNVFSLFLHLPNEMMLPSHKENYVEFKRKKDIIVTAKSYTADESMRKFTPKSRGCYFEGEKKLKFFKTYTKALCEFECMTNYTLKICGCVKFSMPRAQATPVCPLEKVDCYVDVMTAWPYYNQVSDRFDATCDCLKTCNDIKYEFKFEKISTAENVMVILDVLNISKEDIVSRISLMIDDFEILEYEEYATYKFHNFVADVGGLLGFFLGCSILSIVEVCYFIVDIFIIEAKALFARSSKGDTKKKKKESTLKTSIVDQQKNVYFVQTLRKISDDANINQNYLSK